MLGRSVKMLARSAVSASVLLALAGCAVQMPDTAKTLGEVTPADWSIRPEGIGQAVQTEQFWHAWQDPQLETLIARACEANPDVLSAQANLRSARALLSAANAELWPGATLSGSGSSTRRGGHTSESYDASLAGDWTFNLAGSAYALADSRRYSAVSKELALADARELIAAETAQAYINLRAAYAQREVVSSSVALYVKTAEMAQWRNQAGMGSAAEAEDARVKLANAQARLPELERAVMQYRNAIARLCAVPADRLEVNTQTIIPEPPSGIAVAIPAQTLMRRPDVLSKIAALRSEAEGERKARADFFPTLSLRGTLGTEAASLGALGAAGSGIASLVGALSAPVLNWGSLNANVESARASVDAAKAAYISALTGALEETDNALQGIVSAEKRAGDLQSALEHAERSYRYAEFEYRSGVGDYATLLNAEISLLGARENLISNRATRANQYVMLYRALGGSWAVENRKGNENVSE